MSLRPRYYLSLVMDTPKFIDVLRDISSIVASPKPGCHHICDGVVSDLSVYARLNNHFVCVCCHKQFNRSSVTGDTRLFHVKVSETFLLLVHSENTGIQTLKKLCCVFRGSVSCFQTQCSLVYKTLQRDKHYTLTA